MFPGEQDPRRSLAGEEVGTTAWGEAPGKVILSGEHAVVYGHPAIAVGLGGGGVRVKLHRLEGGEAMRVRVYAPDLGLEGWAQAGMGDDGPEVALLIEALTAMLEMRQIEARPGRYAFEIHSRIPVGRGLGSSTAVGVAALRAVLALDGRCLEGLDLWTCAQGVDAVFHGRSSGVDGAAVAYGGFLLYRRGSPPTVQPVLCSRPLNALLIDSGSPGSTAQQVARVAEAKASEPERVGRILDQIGALTLECVAALESGDLRQTGSLLNLNHELLQALGVSTPILDDIVLRAESGGALGAKLTGAGGGGCVLALLREREDAEGLASLLAGAGYESQAVELGAASAGRIP